MRSNTVLLWLRRAIRMSPLAVSVALLTPHLANPQTYSVVHSFTGPPDGKYAESVLARDSAGNLYGTTTRGGLSYEGTAFKLDSSGKETILYNFLAGYGAFPIGALVWDEKGTLYGATMFGGDYGSGTVFKLDKRGNETVLYSFKGGGGDGATPYSGPILDPKGNLYGTTALGGYSKNGIVYKINGTTGEETVLHRFTGDGDGSNPYGSLVRDSAGNLYGTTGFGGNCGGGYCGEVFKIGPDGKFTILYGFMPENGYFPVAGLILDPQGNLYGTTFYGGNLQCGPYYQPGCGVVYRIDPKGKGTVLYAFNGTDGAYPAGGVARDTAGNLYGTTWGGGSNAEGVLFKLDPTGRLTVLHNFAGPPSDGYLSAAGVLLDSTGIIYGTTQEGGGQNWGTVFKVAP